MRLSLSSRRVLLILLPGLAALTLASTTLAFASPARGAETALGIAVPTRVPPPTPLPPPPPEAHIVNLRGHKQAFSLSCEARAAATWAGYFGVQIDEETFVRQLPTSDNPDYGFVGDLNGPWGKIPPDGYGVHAWPVAAQLRVYGLNAYAHRRLTWEDLQRQIAVGQPVIVWVVGHVEPGKAERYVSPTGLTITVARYEHTVLVTGYTAEAVEILDGKKTYTRPVERFLESWAVLGNMAIVRGLLPVSAPVSK